MKAKEILATMLEVITITIYVCVRTLQEKYYDYRYEQEVKKISKKNNITTKEVEYKYRQYKLSNNIK